MPGVIRQPKGGGLGGMLGSILGLGAMFIPGLQPIAPFLGAASSLASGNPASAATSLLGAFVPGLQGAAPFLNGMGALIDGNPTGAATSLLGAFTGGGASPAVNEEALNQSLYEAMQKMYPNAAPSGWELYRQTLNDDRYKNLQSLWGDHNRRRAF